MKMIAINSIQTGEGNIEPGSIADFEPEEARDMFACGAAEPVTWPVIRAQCPLRAEEILRCLQPDYDWSIQPRTTLNMWLTENAESHGLAPLLNEADPAVAFACLFNEHGQGGREERARLWALVPDALCGRDAKLQDELEAVEHRAAALEPHAERGRAIVAGAAKGGAAPKTRFGILAATVYALKNARNKTVSGLWRWLNRYTSDIHGRLEITGTDGDSYEIFRDGDDLCQVREGDGKTTSIRIRTFKDYVATAKKMDDQAP